MLQRCKVPAGGTEYVLKVGRGRGPGTTFCGVRSAGRPMVAYPTRVELANRRSQIAAKHGVLQPHALHAL